MQKITPHLWFDKEARDAAKLYTSVFPDSKISGTGFHPCRWCPKNVFRLNQNIPPDDKNE